MTTASAGASGGTARMVVRFALLILLLPALLFIAAGTIDWPMAWLYTLLTLGLTLLGRLLVAHSNPDVIAERGGQRSQEGLQEWDRWLLPLVGFVGPAAMLVVCGLDKRFTWSPAISLEIQIGALILTVAATLLATWAMVSNKFFSAVVRIQRERGHTTVDSGPYRLLRHPGYAAGIVAAIAGPIALGSLWGVVAGAVHSALIIYRTQREDEVLQQELPGYREYTRRVRYRLLPGVW